MSISLMPMKGAISPPSPYTARLRRSRDAAPRGGSGRPQRQRNQRDDDQGIEVTAERMADEGLASPNQLSAARAG